MKPPPEDGGNSLFAKDDRDGDIDQHCHPNNRTTYDHDGFADLVGADVSQFGGGLGRFDVGRFADGDLEDKEEEKSSCGSLYSMITSPSAMRTVLP